MLRTMLLIFASTSFLAGCATAPSAPPPTQVVTVCPRLPALEPLDPQTQAALETDFTGTMQRLLQGLAPLAIDYGLRSQPAGLPGNPTSRP